MTSTFDTILKGGTVVNQDGEGVRDIGISGGQIAEIGVPGSAGAGEIVDCKGLHILPGVIDTQVHFREPGLTHKEDLETGSRSAVLGGVTAVFEMPNTDPLTITAETFADKIKRAHHRMHCDFAFFIGGTRENYRELPMLERAPGCSGVKVFMGSSTGSLLLEDEQGLRDVLSHPVWRDETAAMLATQRLVKTARDFGKRVHVLHISTRQEIDFLRAHKDVASCEVTPHHLTMAAPECYERLGSHAQMNPPVRDAE